MQKCTTAVGPPATPAIEPTTAVGDVTTAVEPPPPLCGHSPRVLSDTCPAGPPMCPVLFCRGRPRREQGSDPFAERRRTSGVRTSAKLLARELWRDVCLWPTCTFRLWGANPRSANCAHVVRSEQSPRHSSSVWCASPDRSTGLCFGLCPSPWEVLPAVHHRRTPPPQPTNQSDHRGKKGNLPLGKSGRAILGTHTFGSQTPPPRLLSSNTSLPSPGFWCSAP